MSKWSKELQEKTKNELFLGAMVKDEEHNFGFVVAADPKVIIKGVAPNSFMPLPSEETIATFDSVEEMVDSGWVLD